MKIEQIIEGRAEEIDKAIAALRAEKAALGRQDREGGDIDVGRGRSVRADGTDARIARGGGIDRPNTPPPGTQVAALPNTPPPGTQQGTQVAAGTGADGPAGRYAPRQVAAGTGAGGPPGRNYATSTPEVDDFGSMTAAEKATAYRNKMHAIPDKQSQQILNTEKSKRQSAQALAYDRAQSKERSDRIVNTEKSKRQTAQSGAFDKLMKNAGMNPARIRQMEKPIGGGTAKKGDDNAEWYNSPGTKMKPDTAKYADTGEAPEIQKPQGNLLKWMKANATKRKEFDQDAANK